MCEVQTGNSLSRSETERSETVLNRFRGAVKPSTWTDRKKGGKSRSPVTAQQAQCKHGYRERLHASGVVNSQEEQWTPLEVLSFY